MNGAKKIQVGCRIRIDGRLGWWSVVAIKNEKIRCCQCINTVSSKFTHISYKTKTERKKV